MLDVRETWTYKRVSSSSTLQIVQPYSDVQSKQGTVLCIFRFVNYHNN